MIPAMLPSEYLGYYARESTRMSLQNSLRRYITYVTGEECTDVDASWSNYLNERDAAAIASDLMNFYRFPGVSDLAPLTVITYLSGAEGYLRDTCEISLTPLQKRLRRKRTPERPRPLTQDAEPSREMWQAILRHCDERTSAELLIALSGGLRIGETLKLQHADVDMTKVPTEVHISAKNSKNGLARTTYISREATEALKSYYLVRDAHIALAKCKSFSSKHDYNTDLIFPFAKSGELGKLRAALIKAGYGDLDPATGRGKVHFHLARKWFLTTAKSVAHPEYVEAWAGHEGYLASAYHRPTSKQDREEYLKAEVALTINVPEDYQQIKLDQSAELDELRKNNERLTSMLHILQSQLETMQMQQKELMVAHRMGESILPKSGACETNDDESD